MNIILKEDIAGLGYKNDVVKVKDGYARNYLIPQAFAVMATDSAKKILAENIKQAAHKAEKIKTEATKIANGIGEMVLEIRAKVGETGKIFGSVTTIQISDALKAQGFDIDRKKISITGDVKVVGEYKAVIDLHKEVKHSLSFKVVGE